MANFFDNKARAAAAAASASSAATGANGASGASSSKTPESSQLQPWVEKYRPKTLNDVAAQDHTINVLQRTLQASNLPHMLFYGPPGTGKTSTILALAKELFGPELYRSRVLELNASDERGINVVREKIKDFARAQLSTVPAPKTTSTTVANNTNNSTRSRRHPCPPFKLIVLDEADSMTQDAQAALRRTMETYSRLTRFCLVCNYVTRIIDPLASRCSKFRFKSLDRGSARARLAEIAAAERVPLGRNGDDGDGAGAVLDTLIRCSDGDLRKAITFLQSAARLVGAVKPQQRSGSGGGGGNEGSGDTAGGGGGGGSTAAKGKRSVIQDPDAMDVDEQQVSPQMPAVTVKIVEEIAGVIPTEIIEALVQAMRPRAKGTVYEAISSIVTDMVADGWSGTQVVSQLYQEIIFSELIPDKQKNRILLVFSEVDKRLVDGADEHLQILDLALRISNILAGA